MQNTPDISTRTLIALVATILGITGVLTTFLLYRTYKNEIRQFIRQLCLYAPRFPTPAYVEHPGGAFIPRRPRFSRTLPQRYVPTTDGASWSVDNLPPLFPSRSTGLSSLADEQDIGQEGGHIIHDEYEEVPTIPDPILSEERIQILITPSSPLSSPEFPLREPGIPVVIHPTLPPSQNISSGAATTSANTSPPLDPTPTYDELIQQLAKLQQEKNWLDSQRSTTKSSAPMPATELSLISTAAQLARDWRRNPTPATGPGSKAALKKPALSMRQTLRSAESTHSSSNWSGSSDIDSIAQTSSSKDSLGSLSIRGWSNEPVSAQMNMTSQEQEAMYMSIWRSRRAGIPTEVTWMHSEEGQAWRLADPAEQEDMLSYSADVQATILFNEKYPRYAYPTPAPYQSRFTQKPLPKNSPSTYRKPSSRTPPKSPPIHHRTHGMYLGKGRVQARSGGAEAGGSAQPPIDNPVDDNDSDIVIEEPDPEKKDGKDKKPEKGTGWQPGLGFFKGDRPPGPYDDPVAKNAEQWSLPGAPDKFDPEQDPPNPIGPMGEDAPWIGCKPDLIRKPLPFLGEPDDIDRFITDCQMYFQVHSAYMWLDPYRVTFASSYFEGRAKDWWTLQLAELYSSSRGKYRFPTWYAFKEAGMTTTEYFQELELLAKKARLQNDVDDREHMVTALRQGVPASYTTMIANIGVGIPVGYDQWREQIETMNEERWRKEAIDAVGSMYQPRPQQNTKSTPSPATPVPAKKTSTGTTYGGRGQPMDIDAVKSGDCFRCGKKGHISKNCPLQSWNKGKQEVRASTTESTDSKIEEVKDAAGK
ncbi:hypothetical protein ARMSODRAFT_975294 [Armillaria solidipes]|uniref:CCHC-type domain-containing protein n=1 Tax=Armillaria solidipes TaxID=1076256 RepID=A0A2H3C102_9AGAR|nr:hypothetical protein ARMSODRAFT_975294 [Armillaria solidipes]